MWLSRSNYFPTSAVILTISTPWLGNIVSAMPLDVDWIRSIDNTDTRTDGKGAVGGDNMFRRITESTYEDGGLARDLFTSRPNARNISNVVFRQVGDVANMKFLTDIVWQWGQFLGR